MSTETQLAPNTSNTAVQSLQNLSKIFPPVLTYVTNGEAIIKTSPAYLIPLLTFLKHHTGTYYRQLRDQSAVDYPERKLRFEVYYHLLSRTYNNRVTVTVSVGEGFPLESATGVFPSAGWLERETWDRFGIFFSRHPDLRRRLTDYGFKGHPLRKDFPVTGFVEVRYDDFRKRIVYEGVSLAQEYRQFTLENPWSQT